MIDDGDPASTRSLLTIVGLVALGMCAVVVARNVFTAASTVFGWALAAAVVAMLVSPIVDVLDRPLPRPLAILTAVVFIGAIGLAVVTTLRTEIREQVDLLQERGPETAESVEARTDRLGAAAREIALTDRVRELTERLDDNVGSTGEAIQAAAVSAPPYFISGILTIFLVIFGPRMVDGAVRLIAGDRWRSVRLGLSASVVNTQRYVWTMVLQGTVVGVAVWLAGLAVGAPGAGLLGLIAAIASVVPYIGILLGALPLIVISLGVAPLWQAGLIAIAAFAVQMLEAFVWRRFVDRRSLYVGPAIPVMTGVLGFALYGVGGAIVSVVLGVLVLAVGDQLSTHDDITTPVDDYEPEPTSQSIRRSDDATAQGR